MQPMPRPRPLARGASLIEGLVAIAVLTVALGLAAPGIGKARERRHLDGIAAQLETDLQQARTLAVSMNRTVRLSFAGGAGGSCYFIHTGTPDGCACGPAGAACPGGEVMRSVHVDADSPVTLRANVRSMVFAPELGTVTPTATMRIEARSGTAAVHQIINLMGRVRSCTPTPGWSGYPAC